jgi:hypothetical protein
MKNDNQQPMTNGIQCGESFAILLGDYFDGVLSAQKAAEVRQHMDSCENCKGITRMMQGSRAVTQKACDSKTEYLHGISESKINHQIESIKQSIRMEFNEKQQPPVVESKSNNSKTFFVRFPKRISFLYTAAGFVVILSVLALFIGGNNIWNKATKSTDLVTNASGNYEAATQETSGGITNETDASCPVAYSGDNSAQYPQSDKGLFSGESAPREIMVEAINSILIAEDRSNDLIEAMQGSVAYIEVSNVETSYVSIAAYPDNMIQKKVDALFAIGDQLRFMNLTIEIEIISGENSQKLVEYTSRENVTFLQEIAADKAAEFLVITINR